MNIAKAWIVLRGYKRHAGAIMAMLPVILQLCGIGNEQFADIYKALEALGALIWGIGWVDKGAATVTESMKKK